jgi:hypothetical protein
MHLLVTKCPIALDAGVDVSILCPIRQQFMSSIDVPRKLRAFVQHSCHSVLNILEPQHPAVVYGSARYPIRVF